VHSARNLEVAGTEEKPILPAELAEPLDSGYAGHAISRYGCSMPFLEELA
jgi:hypothetical protein